MHNAHSKSQYRECYDNSINYDDNGADNENRNNMLIVYCDFNMRSGQT